MTSLADQPMWVLVVLTLVVVWDFCWRVPALWRSARNGHKAWFFFLLVVNSVGILPIVYFLTAGKQDKR